MTPDRYQEPKGLNWGHFKNAQGADIRYASVAPAGEVKGRVVLLSGFRESIEKYYETMADLLDRGYEVFMMDWRGQGGSSRYLPATPHRSHSEGYDEQLATLHQFVETVLPKSDKPAALMAHSMGGHLGLRYLKEHPGYFAAGLFTAPMLDINTGMVPKTLARQIAKFAKAGNYLERYVPGGKDWIANDQIFEGNDKTSDANRFYNWIDILEKDPNLQMGDATYGWLYNSFKSIDTLNAEDYLKDIKTPVLMASAENDKIVMNAAIDRAASLLPDCKHVVMAGAEHEILQERDEIRNKWLAEMDGFMKAKLEAPQPKKSTPHNAKRPAGPKAA